MVYEVARATAQNAKARALADMKGSWMEIFFPQIHFKPTRAMVRAAIESDCVGVRPKRITFPSGLNADGKDYRKVLGPTAKCIVRFEVNKEFNFGYTLDIEHPRLAGAKARQGAPAPRPYNCPWLAVAFVVRVPVPVRLFLTVFFNSIQFNSGGSVCQGSERR